MRLIGLNGRRGSGKDQTFQYIQEWADGLGFESRRLAFADKLKISAMRALGFDGPEEECVALANLIKQEGSSVNTAYDHPEHTRRGLHITGRLFLQRYGTEAHRDVFGEDFWINAALPTPYARNYGDDAYDAHLGNQKRLEERYPGVDILVVTDVRFENEAARIIALGGEVWEVRRPTLEHSDAHASEQPLPDRQIDYVIVNDSNLSVLANRTWEALSR